MTKESKVMNYPESIDTRVALLEMSIVNINETMKEIKFDIKEMRKDSRTDFRCLLTFMIGLAASLGGIMAHGFHWF